MAPPQSTGPHRCDLRPAQRPAYKMIAAGQLATALAATSLEAYLGPPALIYSCLALLISFATWLTFFHT